MMRRYEIFGHYDGESGKLFAGGDGPNQRLRLERELCRNS